jgi:predicted nucleic acid-binding protein
VVISCVTEAELRYGVAASPNSNQLESLVEDFLLTVTILAWDSAAVKQYGWLRAFLKRERAADEEPGYNDRRSRACRRRRPDDE